jgi:hypothetical protein
VIHVTADAPRRGLAFFNSSAAAGGENYHRCASGVINRERKKKLPLDVDLFFYQHRFDRKLPHFHRQHARGVRANLVWRFGESYAADAGTTRGPGLDFDYDFTAFLPNAEFGGRCGGVIWREGGLTAGNLKSIGSKNRLALIFMKSCHGWVLFRMIQANFQSVCGSEA